MRVLITGGGGFLGTKICARLTALAIPTISYSRHRYPHLQELGITQVVGDIADGAGLKHALVGIDCVFHVAAKVGVSGNPLEFERTNVEGTLRLIEACRETGVGRMVFTSSPSVVFDGRDQNGIDETAPYPQRYLADYPRTKAHAERLVLDAVRAGQLRAVALRPHLIWGPGDPHLVARVLKAAKAGRLSLVGDGENLVDAVYVDNAADAHITAMLKLFESEQVVNGKVFFITNHDPWPLRRLVNEILAAARLPQVHRSVSPWLAYFAGTALEYAYHLLEREDEPPITRFVARQLATAHWYNPAASRDVLGYRPMVSMAEGFQQLSRALSVADGGMP